jgi:hypothetical protein
MKKAIITFLLASVLTAGAFAQITFSGSAYAGIRLQVPQDGDETISTIHREEDRVPTLNLMATVTRANYGARLDTTFEMADDPDDHFTLNGIYGWVDFMDNSLRLTMGQISSTPWVLTRFHHSHAEQKFGDIRGFRLEYGTPIQGLNVGAAFRANNHDAETFSQQMILGATFVHPMFSTVFAYDLGGNVRTLLGFNFIGIPDLTAGFQLQASRLASWDDEHFPGILLMHQIVGYRITRPLSVYLVSRQHFINIDDFDAGLEFIPVIEYRFLPNLTGSFSVIIESPDYFSTTNLTLNPLLEKMLAGPAIFYVEYSLHLPDMNMNRAVHTFGFGITIFAF